MNDCIAIMNDSQDLENCKCTMPEYQAEITTKEDSCVQQRAQNVEPKGTSLPERNPHAFLSLPIASRVAPFSLPLAVAPPTCVLTNLDTMTKTPFQFTNYCAELAVSKAAAEFCTAGRAT